jgi:hypothetical protein
LQIWQLQAWLAKIQRSCFPYLEGTQLAKLVRNLSKLSNAGVLADRNAASPNLDFKRFNLIYGFNGSGKSTLSRCFASIQKGSRVEKLPSGCVFEFQADDGSAIIMQQGGLADQLAVFNGDFVEENLQWSAGKANPVFYIGREQAEQAAELEKAQADLPKTIERKVSSEKVSRAKEQTLTTFKRERARFVSGEIGIGGRSYEAPQLTADYQQPGVGSAVPAGEQLEASREACRMAAPLASIPGFSLDCVPIAHALDRADALSSKTPSVAVLDELERNPSMLMWVSPDRRTFVPGCLEV